MTREQVPVTLKKNKKNSKAFLTFMISQEMSIYEKKTNHHRIVEILLNYLATLDFISVFPVLYQQSLGYAYV